MSNTTSANRADYVFAQGRDRERTAVERLVLGPNADHFQSILGGAMGWPGRFTWYALRIPKSYVIPGSIRPDDFKGDIDLMGGPVTFDPHKYTATFNQVQQRYPGANRNFWQIASSMETLAAGGLAWPPSLENLGAVETKCVYLDAAGDLRGVHLGSQTPKSKHNRLRRLQMQVTNLTEMGFDLVALLWLVVTEPVLTPTGDGSLWMEAAFRSQRAIDQLRGLSSTTGLALPFGEIVAACGAVPGAIETQRGAAGGVVRSSPPLLTHPPGSLARTIRDSIALVLDRAFRASPVPRSVPVVIRACASTICRSVFVARSGDPPCPRCGGHAL